MLAARSGHEKEAGRARRAPSLARRWHRLRRVVRRRAREREMVELLLVKQFAQGHRLVRRADGRRC